MKKKELQEIAEKFVENELELRDRTLHRHDCVVSFIEGYSQALQQPKWIEINSEEEYDKLPNDYYRWHDGTSGEQMDR